MIVNDQKEVLAEDKQDVTKNVEEKVSTEKTEKVEVVESNDESVDEEKVEAVESVEKKVDSQEVIDDSKEEKEEKIEAVESVEKKVDSQEVIDDSKEEKEEKVEEVEEERKTISPEEELIEMIDDSFANIQAGKIVDGTIVSINDQEVMVDIGYKSEGAIPVSEFANSQSPVVDSIIKVYIGSIHDGGRLSLSKKRADFFINQRKLEEANKANETVRGKLVRRVKGGMIAQIYGLEAFLPGSQIALKPIPNLDQFIGKEAEFKIIKLDTDRRNIIVSRKKVIEDELKARRDYLKKKIEIGVELDGEVKNITDYGAFIDLGGIDGLLHITDMSWGHIKHPSEMLNIG
ncbi:MAG: S1 RNA-binding domain-containing protein, partial [Candidatus Cloacimonadota bacterium]|nr:S1 RNA-binding domain-containing protein [Candidatus Cloacimonadota bacterium]